MVKMPTCRVKHIQFWLKRYPNPAATVLKNRPYFAVGNGIGIERVGWENLKPAAVVAVQPILGRNPGKAVPALKDIIHKTLRQTIRCGKQLIVGLTLWKRLERTKQKQEREIASFQTVGMLREHNFNVFCKNVVGSVSVFLSLTMFHKDSLRNLYP